MTLVSAVVATVGRVEEIPRLIRSLEAQTHPPCEVIVVDQNDDDRLTELFARMDLEVPLVHLRTPEEKGASRGRNRGWREAKGDAVIFPDDDCWYPEWLLEQMVHHMETTGAEIVSGRAADEHGRSINGRFQKKPGYVDRWNVWLTHIEWMGLYQRSTLEKVGGFSVSLGPGADTPWQCCEAQDIVLRALDAGFTSYYRPDLFGHHRDITEDIDLGARKKTRAYARALGCVLRRHGYGPHHAIYWSSRALARAVFRAARGKSELARVDLGIAIGRLEGYVGGD